MESKTQKTNLPENIKRVESFLKVQNISNWSIQQRLDFSKHLLSVSTRDRDRFLLDMKKVRDNPELFFESKDMAEKMKTDIQDFLVDTEFTKLRIAEGDFGATPENFKITKKELYELRTIFKDCNGYEGLDKKREQIREKKREEKEYNPQVYKTDLREERKGQGRGTRSGGGAEWNTPKAVIESARNVMGSIELDPASNDNAQKIIKANRYYTQEMNGLTKPWDSKTLWLNPPFQPSLIMSFVKKFLNSYDQIGQAMILTSNSTDAQWFKLLAQNCDYAYFPPLQMSFLRASTNKEEKGSHNGQVIFGFKIDQDKFISQMYAMTRALMKKARDPYRTGLFCSFDNQDDNIMHKKTGQ